MTESRDEHAFRPAWWLPGPHSQTLWPHLVRRTTRLTLSRERVTLPDGDCVDLDWAAQATGPTVLLLHGLEGSIASPYAKGMMLALQAAGLRPVFMHFRGCSGEPNLLPRGYHAGDTGDPAFVAWYTGAQGAVGFSLGGNMLLKWLGELGAAAHLQAAAAVSVPFDLKRAAWRVNQGFSKLYQWDLMRRMKASVARKAAQISLPVDVEAVRRARTFHAFDDLVTAPLHGFASAEDYYAQSSCRSYMKGIRVPTLVLHARDDPFVPADAIPHQRELGVGVNLEVSEAGGHVGFVAGAVPGWPRYWLEECVPAFLAGRLAGVQRVAGHPAGEGG